MTPKDTVLPLLYVQLACLPLVTIAFKLSTINTNDCSGSGEFYEKITNEADCQNAFDELEPELTSSTIYQGPVNDISVPSGCTYSLVPNPGVFFNFDPTGSANSIMIPICNYVSPFPYYKLASSNTEDCSTAGSVYELITDIDECEIAAGTAFSGSNFVYDGLCDSTSYPNGCFLKDMTNIYFGNSVTGGTANTNASPICKYIPPPSSVPSNIPSTHPSTLPSIDPSLVPSAKPSIIPSSVPSDVPSVMPSFKPSSIPSLEASAIPSDIPSSIPSVDPSVIPSFKPSSIPSLEPSTVRSDIPSNDPSDSPSVIPSFEPSLNPSTGPSDVPSISLEPTSKPTDYPSEIPSEIPSFSPTKAPSGEPTYRPSSIPSGMPTKTPSSEPTENPSSQPTGTPTKEPSGEPSKGPTAFPSVMPSKTPTSEPSSKPSTSEPTSKPSVKPTTKPSTSSSPSISLSTIPSGVPTGSPSRSVPSLTPSKAPSNNPTMYPTSSTLPTVIASHSPTILCVNDINFSFENKERKNCAWIMFTQERRERLCRNLSVQNSCPISCGLCCEDSPTFKFNITANKVVKCQYLKTSDLKDEFCSDKVIKAECAFRCRNCQAYVQVETKPTKCIDIEGKFIVWTRERSCNQVKNRHTHLCSTSKVVQENCRVTCGLCDEHIINGTTQTNGLII